MEVLAFNSSHVASLFAKLGSAAWKLVELWDQLLNRWAWEIVEIQSFVSIAASCICSERPLHSSPGRTAPEHDCFSAYEIDYCRVIGLCICSMYVSVCLKHEW